MYQKNKTLLMQILIIFLILFFINFTCAKIVGDAITDHTFDIAKDSIKQKAIDVAKQVEVYIHTNPDKTIKDLQEDPYFQKIAVQQVGDTGYTALTDYDTLICRFHSNPKIVNLDLSTLSEKLPGFWEVMSKTKGGVETEGIYDWQEADGSLRKKYMYIAIVKERTADGVGLSVAATTYLDEYTNSSTPIIENNDVLNNEILRKTKQSKETFYDLEDKDIKKIKTLLESFIQKEEYKKIFLENNRTKLYDYSQDLFQKNKEESKVTHFYYIYTNSTDFVRIHNLNIFGDKINRITFKESKESNSWGTGIELGKTAFALRVVHPYYYQKELIGYVEFGEEIDHFLEELKKETTMDYGIIVKKNSINEQDWASVRANKGLRNNYNDLKNYVAIENTGNDLIFNQECFPESELNSVRDEGNIFGTCIIGDKTYATSGFSLYDAANNKVGAVVLSQDVTEFLQDQGLNINKIILISTGILIFILIIFFVLQKLNIIKIKKNALLFILSFVMLVIIVIFILNSYQTTKSLEHHITNIVSNNLNSLAEAKENQINKLMEEEKEKLKIIATNSKLSQEELVEINELEKDFYEIFILDANGTVIECSVKSHKGSDLSDRKDFLNGLNTTYISAPFFSEISNKESIAISTPYNNGVLVAKIGLDSFNKLTLDRTGLGKTGESLLAYKDENGDAKIFTQRRFEENYDSKDIISKDDLEIPITQALLKNEQIFLDYHDYRNVPVIATTRYIEELDFGLVIKQDKQEALKDFSNATKNIWISTLAMIILIIAMGIIFNYLLTKSLKKEVKEKTKELESSIENLKKTKTALLNMMEDMDKANEDLKKLDKAKSEFLNMVSHELKTPLTAIIAYLDIIKESNTKFSDEDKMGIEVIKRNANSLKQLIGNILEIARMESGKFSIAKRKENLTQLLKEVIEDTEILAKQKGIKINLKSKSKLMANVDPERIKEVFTNLISNSIKFTDKGSIDIELKKSGSKIIGTVKDTGVGIPKEKINNLFQKFYQVDASLSRKYGGTGLGLSITKRIIKAHNGTIKVSSKENKGTSFTITLPIK